MEIEIQSRGFAITDALRSYIGERLQRVVTPFNSYIRRVVARLGDENGPRGGNDKRCYLGVSIDGAPAVVVIETRSNLYLAIDNATERLARAITRTVRRKRQSRRIKHARAALVLNDGAEHVPV